MLGWSSCASRWASSGTLRPDRLSKYQQAIFERLANLTTTCAEWQVALFIVMEWACVVSDTVLVYCTYRYCYVLPKHYEQRPGTKD